MSLLHVPGARLHYETRGSGPLLLMIPGATGSAKSFEPVADQLAAHFTVVTYDRRGFSQSRLDGPQDDAQRLETDAADARSLIEHTGNAPAIVFGGSSGGIVALAVLTHHPSVVRRLVPFEPPAVRLLPDGQRWVDFFFGVHDLYHHSGIEPALATFRQYAFAESDRRVMTRAPDPRKDGHVLANAAYWFDHELRQYPAVDIDLEGLRAYADRIVPAAGRESRGYPCYEVSLALGKRLGREVVELPGGHVGYVAQPADFARALRDSLAGTANRPRERRPPPS